ncbi:MAG: stage III sporulation protein AF [Lachnospiraceae bacterium]|nr:stage III sporulation protein AF [Lachnospiraceae bacterium]
MEAFYGWIRNLTGYFLFLSILGNLLPGKKYAKYIRLFSGMILILLVLQPLVGGLKLEDTIARYYKSFVFQDQAADLKQDILGIEAQRLEQVIAQYEQAVAVDVTQMARDMDWTVKDCKVTINAQEGTEAFGMVEAVYLTVVKGAESGAVGLEPKDGIRPVEPVQIDAQIEVQRDSQIDAQIDPPREAPVDSEEAAGLRRKIAAYYDLEESHVEIRVLEEKR